MRDANKNRRGLAPPDAIVHCSSIRQEEADVFHSDVSTQQRDRAGLTLIETLLAIGLFAIIATAIYSSFANILEISTSTQLITSATQAIQSQIEVIRNMSFADVGVVGGWPVGKLPPVTSTVWNGTPFIFTHTVRNIDDPFDGTLGGTPNDTSPADYKLIEIQASCPKCGHFIPIVVTARVAPRGLETASNNGSLFIKVFDASGTPIPGATVVAANMSTTPTIQITDTTNNDGILQLVDIPTSTSNYQISVSKTGYSSAKTYPIGAPGNPNPVSSHATVAKGQVTQVSLAIDRFSTLLVQTRDSLCAPVGNVSFSEAGSKLIGTSPDVFKFATTTKTSSTGDGLQQNLEWDTYTFTNTDATREISGYIGLGLGVNLTPASTTALWWRVAIKNPSALLVSVVDQSSTLISGVTTTLTKAGFSAVQSTGRDTFAETAWPSFTSASGVDTLGTPGSVKLAVNASGTYTTSVPGTLISNTFDLGTSTATYYAISWEPTAQPPAAGAGSVSFQIAVNNDNATWNFIGPDGTGATFFTQSGAPSTGFAGRYFRYKMILKTLDKTVTPQIDRVIGTYGKGCVPPGQAYFDGLASGAYTLSLERAGFQPTSTAVTIGSAWVGRQVQLSP